MGPCPGRCNAQFRQAREAYDKALADYDPLDPRQERPEPPSIRPWEGDPVWCPRDAARIRQCLAELDDAAALLQAGADGMRETGPGQRVSGSQEHPSPSPAADDLDELASMLTGWEDAYRTIMGWPSAPRRGFLASLITSSSAWLGSHLDGVLACGDIAADFGDEVATWHRELTGKARAGTRRLRKPMRCPGCALLTLAWTEGEAYVRCTNRDGCGRVLTLAEYEAMVAHRAGDPEAA